MSKKNYKNFYISNFLLLIMIIISGGGCGVRKLASGEVAPPSVEFLGLKVQPPDSQYWPITAILRLHNPNPEPLRVLGYDYEVAFEGTDIVHGQSIDTITLPAQGENVVEIPILLKLQAVPQALKAFLLKENIRYDLAGGFRLASLLGGLRVPFHFRGEITRQEGLERLREFLDKK